MNVYDRQIWSYNNNNRLNSLRHISIIIITIPINLKPKVNNINNSGKLFLITIKCTNMLHSLVRSNDRPFLVMSKKVFVHIVVILHKSYAI